MYYGFEINGKHSFKDFGLRIIDREFNPPNKVKIKQTVPFMNGSYDFSTLYGEQTYEERIIKYTLNLKYRNKFEYITKKIQITEWLMSGIQKELYDDLIPGYYFLAECENGPVFSEYHTGCEIEVVFIAYPFKMGISQEGTYQLWDTFCFATDYMQESVFDVVGTKDIQLYNVAATKIVPTIICSSNFSIIKAGITYNFSTGTTKNLKFKLEKGMNIMILNGTGNIEFVFRKQVL